MSIQEDPIKQLIYNTKADPTKFNFDALWMRPMCNYLTPQDIDGLYKIATSIKYNDDLKAKYKAIRNIMEPRGFRQIGSGTNRVVFGYLEDISFVAKIALDRIGLGDNPREYKNQVLLKPFVTKVFEVSHNGVIAFVERVKPIKNIVEFECIGEQVFDLIVNKLIGKLALDDFGTQFFMNYGVRKEFGPVLLDFPYVYQIDGSKLQCASVLPTGRCKGTIDYDSGFNELKCSACGRIYTVKEISQDENLRKMYFTGLKESNMKISLYKGDQLISVHDNSRVVKKIVRRKK